MGKGTDASTGRDGGPRERVKNLRNAISKTAHAQLKHVKSADRLKTLGEDLRTLRSLWFKRAAPHNESHKQRLERFYADQAQTYDQFRKSFLWGREPMLAAMAGRVSDREDLVWVDLGGGTAENVAMMAKFLPLSRFKKVYVVDLCPSLVQTAREKVAERGWDNVEVVEADACTWSPPEDVDMVTFSYSLTMIPNFYAAVDNAVGFLKLDGYLGIADFFVSGRYDVPLRQMGWLSRWFWRAVFDTDNIDIGPERRSYLEHKLVRMHEFNGKGPIPFVPVLRAPWYVWIGQPAADGRLAAVQQPKAERPATFPPTFLYSLSWEDPRVDEPVLNIKEGDVLLTLTSGGCNALDEALQGATVYAVDMNPAQSYLLELKAEACRRLPYDDVFKMFGDGVHPKFAEVFERDLAPFMSQGATQFWRKRVSYFRQGFYYQGGMGAVIYIMAVLKRALFLTAAVERFCNAETLEEQVKAWEAIWVVRLVLAMNATVRAVVDAVVSFVAMNRIMLWFGAGVPKNQRDLIVGRDGRSMGEYVCVTLDGAARHTLLRTQNYFYRACLLGSLTEDCCPRFLKRTEFARLKSGVLDRVHNVTGSFYDELSLRMYDKVILMDHADWLDVSGMKVLASSLAKQVVPGGTVIWRSASVHPPYVDFIKEAGFDVRRINHHEPGKSVLCDAVNMYASFWCAVRNI